MSRLKGFKHSEETKMKISLTHKSKPIWYLNLPKEQHPRYSKTFSDESRLKSSITHKRNHSLGKQYGFQKGNQLGKGNQVNKGRIAWNKGKPHPAAKNLPQLFKKGQKLSKEQIKKCLMRRKMSSLEIKFNDLIIKNNLPYKFVGNGEFFIERKNPDFININGEKIAIEVFYKRHKLQISQAKNRTIKEWQEERNNIFKKYGWKLLFFDETEVNEKDVIKKLGGETHS